MWGKGGKECGKLDSEARHGKGDWARCDRPGFLRREVGAQGQRGPWRKTTRNHMFFLFGRTVLVDESWKCWGKFMATRSVLEEQGAKGRCWGKFMPLRRTGREDIVVSDQGKNLSTE